MSVKILKWDNIYTSCGMKPCFYFKPNMELSGKLLENKPCNQTTFAIQFSGNGKYDNVYRVMFDKSNMDNLIYVGIVQTPFQGYPDNTGNFALHQEEYYDTLPEIQGGNDGVVKEKFRFTEPEKRQVGVDVGILIIVFLAILIVCYECSKSASK